MLHKLKCWPVYLDAIIRGDKKFEIRRNDRNFQVGDTLMLLEYDPKEQDYTGSVITREVTYILNDPEFVKEGYVVMSIE